MEQIGEHKGKSVKYELRVQSEIIYNLKSANEYQIEIKGCKMELDFLLLCTHSY